MSKFVCQMYGFRKEIEKNPELCFQKVKDLGFDHIQLDGMRGRDPQCIKDAIEKSGLIVDSMHIKHDRFISDVEGIIAEGELFNCKEVYLKYIEDEFQVEYGYKFTKYALIKAAKTLEEHGFKVGLHSPEYDFNNKVDNFKIMDYICLEEDGIKIHPEPDTYWLSVAQQDIVSYINQYKQRILTIHLKDIDTSLDLKDMDTNLRPCGKGNVDFKSILKWGMDNGIQSFAIEQDSTKEDIYADMKYSFEYLKSIMKELQGE
ncbi:MAG: sugar phosphate isomerase/epimerase family protein [Breznakia sp.]